MKLFFTRRLQEDKRAGFTPLEIRGPKVSNKVSLTGFTLTEALLTVSLLAMVIVAMTPFARSVYTAWRIGDRKTEMQQNGRVGLDVMSRLLRQAKRITGIPQTGSGNFVKFRNATDDQTIIFYYNVPASVYYVGNTGLIKTNDLVMRTINLDGSTSDALLARSLSAFTIDFKNSDGAVATEPYDVYCMAVSMNLVDEQGLIPDEINLSTDIALRPEVRIARPVWLVTAGELIGLSMDERVSNFFRPTFTTLSVNSVLLVNGRETVWVADDGRNRVYRVYWDGSSWATDDYATGFSNPRSVCVNPYEIVNGKETAWVTDVGNDRVFRLYWNGSSWSSDVITGFNNPRSVSVNYNEQVNGRNTCWVADSSNNRVAKIYWNGIRYTYTSLSMGNGSTPYSVSVNPTDGTCWVANYGTGGANGRRIRKLSGPGTGPITMLFQVTGFNRPISVSVDSSIGDCWVADVGNETIGKVTSFGQILFTATGFLNPATVAANPTDHACWVADTGHNQAVKLDSEGNEEFRVILPASPLDVSNVP